MRVLMLHPCTEGALRLFYPLDLCVRYVDAALCHEPAHPILCNSLDFMLESGLKMGTFLSAISFALVVEQGLDLCVIAPHFTPLSLV